MVGRLQTRDRLASWGLSVPENCVFVFQLQEISSAPFLRMILRS
ncbi:unnamed protein product [Brassica rapa]|uniref:Uncharacterized protein n=1 Tax=Brassica campestris TaxID=3711 RepID=A0A3P6CLU4_BRACM|nr:unnamed protein product [Brassica rapa]VDD11021.1 unnamed protein product [Brassica rapa]